MPPRGPRERIVVEVAGRRLDVVLPLSAKGLGGPQQQAVRRPNRGAGGAKAGAAGGDALVSPMQGTIVKVVAADGAEVAQGDTIVVLEAMKMEQPLTAHKPGVIREPVVLGRAERLGRFGDLRDRLVSSRQTRRVRRAGPRWPSG